MFNPPPADLSDREPLLHVASTTEFWYRSHRVATLPFILVRAIRIGGTRPTAISASSTSEGPIRRGNILCYQTGKLSGKLSGGTGRSTVLT